jgi:hypothetical protein
MSRRLLIIIALAILAVGVYFLQKPEPEDAKKQPVHTAPIPPPAAPQNTDVPVTVLPIATDIVPLNSKDSLPADDLATLEVLFAEYRKNTGGNPTGENEEITAALLGKNPKRLAYLPPQGDFLNPAGELIDRWGTPYFFHQISGSQTEIRSAGPDRQLNTADDIVR